MKILLIPLDGRPCNTDLPKSLAAVGGHEVRIPARASLGRFMTPGDTRYMLRFLREEASKSDALVVSADMCVHGGLEVSRDGRLSLEEALKRLNRLEEVLAPFGSKTALFSTLTRGTITVTRESELKVWKAMTAGSRFWGGRDYLSARKRNHEVNKRLAAWRRVSSLLFLQDDTGPKGPHIAELGELARLAGGATVRFMPGADEAGALLVAAAIVKTQRRPVRIRVIPSDAKAMRNFALYEPRAFSESLKSHLEPLNIRIDAEDPEVDFFVNPPLRNSRDLFLEEPGRRQRDTTAFASAIRRSAGDAVLADCAHGNGADPFLMKDLSQAILERLAGFAAWNTASNTLGTALAHAAMIAVGRRDGSFCVQSSRRLTRLRLIDDWIFQSLARPEFARRCISEGLDRFDFDGKDSTLNRALDRRMHELSGKVLPKDTPRYRATFPWGRLFETKITWL